MKKAGFSIVSEILNKGVSENESENPCDQLYYWKAEWHNRGGSTHCNNVGHISRAKVVMENPGFIIIKQRKTHAVANIPDEIIAQYAVFEKTAE